MFRNSILMLAALALSACASIPVDPNIKALAESAERQRVSQADADARSEAQHSAAVKACAESQKVSECMLGLVASDAVRARGGSSQAVSLPNYQRPPTTLEQITGVAAALSPYAGAAANVLVNRDNQRTARAQIEATSARETATVQAIAGLGATIATTDAGRPPSIQVGAGGVLSGGPVTQVGGDLQSGDRTNTTVGRDQTGGDHIDDRHDSTICTAGNGGSGGSSGDPAAGGASGIGGAGAPGGACQQVH